MDMVLCSKKVLDRCQRAVFGTGKTEKFTVFAMDPIGAVRQLRQLSELDFPERLQALLARTAEQQKT